MNETMQIPTIKYNYDDIINIIDQKFYEYDHESPGIMELKKLLSRNRIKIGKNNILIKEITERLDHPYCSEDTLKKISFETQKSVNEVKEFFNNQRKRRIYPIQREFNKEIQILIDKISVPDPALKQYLDSLNN